MHEHPIRPGCCEAARRDAERAAETRPRLLDETAGRRVEFARQPADVEPPSAYATGRRYGW